MTPDELERLPKEATSGKWIVSSWGTPARGLDWFIWCPKPDAAIADKLNKEDAALVVALVNAAPQLIQLWKAADEYVSRDGATVDDLLDVLTRLAEGTSEQ